ncbi:NAD-P-binding protein [Mycena sp. CBHHK59/15]|nr:NAD-P-binding protein [Mycena sp. CBHHK59/15]
MSTTWLITGANRGIGFALVKQLLADPANTVFATCRAPEAASALRALEGKLHIIKLDVGDAASIAESVAPMQATLGAQGLDYLINNAGRVSTWGEKAFTLDAAELATTFRVNTIGPALVTQAYLPLLEKGSRRVIVHVSSSLGSFNKGGISPTAPAYAMSKAALNMLTAKQAAERTDLIPFSVCPGWVSTDMGTKAAKTTPEECASDLVKLITSASREKHAGKFLERDGRVIHF